MSIASAVMMGKMQSDICQHFYAEARDRLRKLREDHLRRSDEVVELWEDVLDCVHYKLGTECMYRNHFRHEIYNCDTFCINMVT